MTDKELIAFISIAIMTVNAAIYIWQMWKKKVRAHGFSWIIWFLTQAIGGAAMVVKGAGAGSWPYFYGALTCLPAVLLAYFHHGERNVTRSDWGAFMLSLLAIPLWLATNNPLWAAALVAGIDTVGGIFPTFRKSWHSPYEENLPMFACATFNYGLTILAMESYSPTTLVYPIVMMISHFAVSAMLILRRRKFEKPIEAPAQ